MQVFRLDRMSSSAAIDCVGNEGSLLKIGNGCLIFNLGYLLGE
jgi:hypothetical protein